MHRSRCVAVPAGLITECIREKLYVMMVHDLDQTQYQASDPSVSVWVSASAGTGKTKVLIDRLLRLLLKGVKPHHIVCLTFTHAAATEMHERLQQTLMQWATMDEALLTAKIAQVLGYKPSPHEQKLAPHLLNHMLDSPMGLRIQTLHQFCQSLLQQFPLECGLDPHFGLLDARTADDLLEQAIVQVFSPPHEVEILQALHRIRGRMEPQRFRSFIHDLLPKRWLLGFLEKRSYASYHDAFSGFGSEQKTLPPEPSKLRTLSHLLNQGSAAEQMKAQTIMRWLDRGMPEDDLAYQQVFMKTQGNEPRAFKPTQKVLKIAPDIQALWQHEVQRLMAHQHQHRLHHIRQDSSALSFLAQQITQAYEHLKNRNHLLDYDDLILYSISLFKVSPQAPWVVQSIMRNIHHILIDEAQDTSPMQWQVIQNIAQEMFTSGYEHIIPKTLFVVGDFKQSIYSFQGADPYYFDMMRLWCAHIIAQAGKSWREVTLSRSYRSSPVLLRWIERVFHNLETHPTIQTLTLDPLEAFRHDAPGHIEVWPLVSASTEAPHEDDLEQPSARRLAQDIAQRIKAWLDQQRFLPARGRPVAPGDIMILLQKRGGLMKALVHSLAHYGIPSTGADRFAFQESQAIQDLLMIARVALFPQDDLALACVLKGPWVGWSEDQLCALCAPRPDRLSVWDHMKHTLGPDHDVIQKIEQWRFKAGYMPPFEFFSHLLERQHGRDALTHRLGVQTHEILDTFLQTCLDFESAHPPTLQHWLDFLDAHDGEIQRDPHTTRDQVRLMSVHSAKGLQAPIVILADAHVKPRLYEHIFLADATPSQLLVWSPRQDQDIPETKALRHHHQQQCLQESLRLLYVALTRAEDELYIAGCGQNNIAILYTWYNWTNI